MSDQKAIIVSLQLPDGTQVTQVAVPYTGFPGDPGFVLWNNRLFQAQFEYGGGMPVYAEVSYYTAAVHV